MTERDFLQAISVTEGKTFVRCVETVAKSLLSRMQHQISLVEGKLGVLRTNIEKVNDVFEHDKNNQAKDTIDEAIQNFALTIARNATPCNARKLVEARVPEILVNVLHGKKNDNIRQAAMALYKISLQSDDIRREIVSVGGICACVPLLQPSQDPLIISYISRLIASLALLKDHRPIMCARGALKALALYVQNASKLSCKIIDTPVSSVLVALCHCTEGNDANRNILIGLEIAKSIRIILNSTQCQRVISCAAKVITNIAYNNAFISQACLDSGCIAHLISDKNVSPSDAEASVSIMSACINLSITESSQIHLGKAGATQAILHLLENSDDSGVLREASTACASICYNAAVIRKQMGKLGAMEALVDVILYKGTDDTEEAKAAEAATLALIALVTEQTNRVLFEESGELLPLIDLYEKTDSMDVLNAGAMFVCAMIPASEEKAVLLREGRTSAIEKAHGNRIIDLCTEWIYGNGNLPNWLKRGIASLRMTEDEATSLLEKTGRKNDTRADSLCKVCPVEYFAQSRLFHEVRVRDQEDFFRCID